MDSLFRRFPFTRSCGAVPPTVRGCAVFLLSVTLAASGSLAQKADQMDRATTKCAETKCEEPTPPPPEEVLSTTEHTAEIGGVEVRYRATAGNLLLKEEDGTPKASVFFVAYERLGEGGAEESPGERPVTFAFNGGPGSSSVWLHLGLLGPRRVDMGAEGWPPPPPYRLVDNPYSLLDLTDLVFIDPVTTGFSRAVPGEDDKEYHGIQEDIESVGELIRLWTARFGRWASPKFLAGESYGTTRAAGLSNYLQQRHGMYLNGVILVSSILDFQTARFDVGNDLPYVLFLPTYAATAHFHERLAPEYQNRPLTDFLDEVETFAREDYAAALMQGTELASEERDRIAARLAAYTGLSEEFVRNTHLRPQIYRFVKELRRDEGVTVGRLDSRFTGVDRDRAGERFEYDPSYAAIQGPYTALLNDYVRRELGYESDLPYEVLTGRVRPWSFAEFENRYVNVAEDLRQAMARNPHLRVFVANGYYDLATPYFATAYTFDHLAFEPGFEERVEMGYYEAGHMMYIREASLARVKQDLARFLDRALSGETQ
jgi:carboxypeptidase C (cathepsin A)